MGTGNELMSLNYKMSSNVWGVNRIPVVWARYSLLIKCIVKILKPSNPPVLILSMPRSGSSWVGNIVGNAEEALYLREPMTQTWLRSSNSKTAIFDIEPEKPVEKYQTIGDIAFSGVPQFHQGIVRNPGQWRLAKRMNRRVVIKEVNPLCTEWIVKRYKPKIIYLVRHPAAVALSYQKLGWTDTNIGEMLIDTRLSYGALNQYKNYLRSVSGFWQEQGARQGAVNRLALDVLEKYPDSMLMKYEDLCVRPIDNFKKIFDFIGLLWSKDIEYRIRQKSASGDVSVAYDTSRDSLSMISSWKDNISPDDQNLLKNAYLKFNLPFYNTETDWL